MTDNEILLYELEMLRQHHADRDNGTAEDFNFDAANTIKRAIKIIKRLEAENLAVVPLNVVDFWPGTGRYNFRKSDVNGRGVKNLIKALA